MPSGTRCRWRPRRGDAASVRALLGARESRAARAGGHRMIGAVSGANPGGRAFHLACGHAEAAVLSEDGRKAGRRPDLHLMMKAL